MTNGQTLKVGDWTISKYGSIGEVVDGIDPDCKGVHDGYGLHVHYFNKYGQYSGFDTLAYVQHYSGDKDPRKGPKREPIELVMGGITKGSLPKPDPVNHPSHYQIQLANGTSVEVIDILEARFGTDPLLWQVGKYLLRAGHKADMLEDLKKLRVYLDRKITKLEAS